MRQRHLSAAHPHAPESARSSCFPMLAGWHSLLENLEVLLSGQPTSSGAGSLAGISR